MVKCPHAASGCDYPASECAGHCASKQQPKALRLADVLDLLAMDMKTPRQAAAEQIDEIVALKAQRDELLEALKDYDDAFTGFDPSSKESRHRMRQAVIKARDAIAKAGGAA